MNPEDFFALGGDERPNAIIALKPVNFSAITRLKSRKTANGKRAIKTYAPSTAKKEFRVKQIFCREHFHLAKAAYERKKEQILKQQLPFEEKV